MSAGTTSAEYAEGVMEAQSRFQNIEMLCDFNMTRAYKCRLERDRLRDAERRTALAEDELRNMDMATTVAGGFEGVPAALAGLEGVERLGKTAPLQAKHERWVVEQAKAEHDQIQNELSLYEETVEGMITSPTPFQTGNISQADRATLRSLFAMARQGNNEVNPEESLSEADKLKKVCHAMPAIQRLLAGTPAVQSHPLVQGFQEMMPFLPGISAAMSEAERQQSPGPQSEGSVEDTCSAGDWARYVVETEGLGPETLLGLARGLTRPVDARNPSDWMSLFWEVAISAHSSSIIRHDSDKEVEEVISELSRASEIFAVSYRHRVHGNQTSLRYRLQECCWADLRQVAEAAVMARPHGRVVLWWDQVLGATAKVRSTKLVWAAVGLLPYVIFRVLYNPPTRCENHNPVFGGRNDFEKATDNQDLRRLWINLEHRLAKRGLGLLMSRRTGADGCVLWNVERVAPAWDGHLLREVFGEDSVPLLGLRKIVAHLLREEVGDREVTYAEDVVELQQWAATLAILPRKDWSLFLAGRMRLDRQQLTVAEVVRMVLRAGAVSTFDGDGPNLPSAPTVECPRRSEGRAWSGVSEWAPLLMENALDGWMRGVVERQARQELERFTAWVIFPIDTDAEVSEALAIGKLWTPVQAVSSYMLVWLKLPTSFECWKSQESPPDSLATGTTLYANGHVRMTQLVWPRKVKQFHETFCGVHWVLNSLRSCAEQMMEYPMGLYSVLDCHPPQANAAACSPRKDVSSLFSCMVEEWGATMTQHWTGNWAVQADSDEDGLQCAAGVPIGVMSGEDVCWT